MDSIISIQSVNKIYENGFSAVKNFNLEIQRGEILALLGPNGAGKTTIISIICGIVNASSGSVRVGGYDIVKQYRESRRLIGLVPQEMSVDTFETPWNTVTFSRGLFGKPKNDALTEKILKDLHLWDKRNEQIRRLSGGMKRRVMIAKALSHEPQVLFLDEPTAGVDVELRKTLWEQVRHLRDAGVTIILTTHYIEEAEEMADRVGILNKGELTLVEETSKLMQKLGKKDLVVELASELPSIPESLASYRLAKNAEGSRLTFTYDTSQSENRVTELLEALKAAGIRVKDFSTRQSSLEDIFMSLVNRK